MSAMKLWRGVFKSSAGNQYVQLLARDRKEARILLEAYNQRRAGRRDITFQRLDERLDKKEITQAQYDHEVERRKEDFMRYDHITADGVEAAPAPMKLTEIEEVKP